MERPLACLVATFLQAPPAATWRECAAAIPWEHAIELENGEARLGELAMAGRLGAWSEEWVRAALEAAPSLEELLERAAERGQPLLWYVPHAAGQQVILPHFLDRYFELGVLSDPDVATLLARRFVAIKRPAGGEVARDLGLVAPDFVEPGLLVFAPGGALLCQVDRLHTFQPEWVAQWLRDALAELGEAARPSAEFLRARAALEQSPGDRRAALAFAEEALANGELEAGREALRSLAENARGAQGWLLLARLARARRDGPEAFDALRRARALGLERDLAGEADALEGLVQLALGHDALAEPLLARAAAGATALAHEAQWALGALQHLSARDEAARATWRALAQRAPDSLFAARADACARTASDGLQGESPLVRAMQDVRWLAPEVYALPSTHWERSVDERADVLARALDFLLRQQRADGSWRGTRWGGDGGDDPPAPPPEGELDLGGLGVLWNIHTAITAQAAAAVHAWRALRPAECERALARAERFLLADEHVQRENAVLWVYPDALRVLHFARRFPDPATRPPEVTHALEEWIAHLVDHQDTTGGPFLHYTYASSFVTACVLLCLAPARDAGLPVPERVFERGADVLERTRDGADGFFGYLVDAPGLNRTVKGAAARQALCEWALFLSGRRDESHVARAIEVYLEHYTVAAELGRHTNFHVPALDAQAGYFFFHDLFATCLATRDAGPARDELRRRLEAKLCALPEIDGSFVDSAFSYGKAYGTAMALLSFDALR
ncbi:MAG TPA: hypothetical protein VF530_21865 [Planctomycetota bacterium]